MNDKNHLRYVTAIFNKIVLDYGYEQIRKKHGMVRQHWRQKEQKAQVYIIKHYQKGSRLGRMSIHYLFS
jgi:uncharacterized protein YutD